MLPWLHDERAAGESIWRSPLVPLALALTAGIVLDRLIGVPFGFALLVAGCSAAAFLVARLGGWARLAPVYLLLAVAACDRGNEDRLGDDVEVNAVPAEDLNALSDQAANLAAEAEALENQSAELEVEAANTTNTSDEAAGAETPADENIQGM